MKRLLSSHILSENFFTINDDELKEYINEKLSIEIGKEMNKLNLINFTEEKLKKYVNEIKFEAEAFVLTKEEIAEAYHLIKTIKNILPSETSFLVKDLLKIFNINE